MKVIVGDIWTDRQVEGQVVVPINWTFNRYGRAVMGRGVARQAADKYPDLALLLGGMIKSNPRTPQICFHKDLILFPVKNHWRDKADLNIIARSLWELRALQSSGTIYFPLLGAGFGELDPVAVLTLMAYMLPSERHILVLKDATVAARYPESFAPSTLANRRDRTV